MKRLVTIAAIAVGAATGLTGCNFVIPTETQYIKDVTDGTNADIGSIEVRNAVLISNDGKTGSLSMTLLNTGASPADVRFQYDTTDGRVTQTLSMAPTSMLFRGTKPGDEQMILSDLHVEPGALIRVFVQSDASTGKMLRIPILTGALNEYKTLLPTPAGTNPADPGDTSSPLFESTPQPTPTN
ncbi:hypothetical protein [Frondihabitans australicus]|uniref:Copper(I)-binding protein n=1 Tax=Frondihabitans australicus TaxID=386892 RepID=A0A495ILN1_9MICO|nr:hypothetical protein [Frondihabitans australicus]RKR76338.1 hypothetical protein C8E83_3507 [Frondihabitans australicus]